jgi:hypothetical protein
VADAVNRQARARRTRIVLRTFFILVYIPAIIAAIIVGRWYVGVVLVPFLIWNAIALARALRSPRAG